MSAVAQSTESPPTPPTAAPNPPPAGETPPVPPAATTPGAKELPPVDVIQNEAKPAPKVRKAAVKKKPAPVQQAAPEPVAAEPEPVAAPTEGFAGPALSTGVRISPVGGSEIPIEKIPGATSVVGQEDLARASSPSITKALEQRVPGVSINDALGNGLSSDLNYRGFSASPLNGTPQGLAIYQNGVRINEVFGDAVYWDNIPQIAIQDIVVMSNNPVFGLNALGGSVNVIMKDGFVFQGVGVETKFGSFDNKSVAVEAGTQYNNQWAAYVAGEYFDDGGWRDRSSAEAKRFYADLGAKGTDSEFHLSYSFNKSMLGVVGPTPRDLVEERRETVFTSPQSFDNESHLVALTGQVDVTDTFKVVGNTYYRSFKQRRPDGNVSEAVPCGASNPGLLCLEEDDDPIFDTNGNNVLFDPTALYGGNDFVSVDSFAYGGTLQGISKARVFERPNQFLLGASIDQGKANSKSTSELGFLDPNSLVVSGSGIIIDQSQSPDCQDGDPATECEADIVPVDLDVKTSYFGLFFSDTLDVTDKLALTVGGRYNRARIKLTDKRNGDLDSDGAIDLNSDSVFERFNPMAGLTYKFSQGLSTYAGYSEANRAPTPAELACADEDRPCLLENFLVSDPPLEQVVARTVEAGFRGEMDTGFAGYDANGGVLTNKVGWSLGYFRTETDNDILVGTSSIQGRGFFQNLSDTLRQGIEAEVNYRSNRLFAYASYAFIDATFLDNFELASPDNPFAVVCQADTGVPGAEPGCVNVNDGDTIPGIARHRFKLGLDYFLTPEWKIGGDMVANTGQFFRGDEGNDDAKLPGYAVFNFRTSYQVTKEVQIFGLVNNVLGTDYETFGTYFDPEPLDGIPVGPTGTVLDDDNPRTVTPAAPRAFYGGLKMRF